MITVIPAIDLKNGQCVRLRQGRADDSTVYGDDPAAMARRWRDEGAAFLHVVDLDGAFEGRPVHSAAVSAIVREMGFVPVEVGGGVRTAEHIRDLLALGVRRAIVGTRACSEPALVAEWGREFGDRLVVGIDARDGRVQVKGWVETTDVTALDLARQLDGAGIRTIIYTDTATDGMLAGPNLRAVETLCRAVSCAVIASGGVADPAHVRALAGLGLPNLAGVIVGKALYDGRATLREMQEAAR